MDEVKVVVSNIVEGEGYQPVRFFKFVVLIYSIRELPWFLFKSANFSKICDTRYWRGKYFKFFLWICNLVAINNITVDGGIVMGKDYRFV